MYTDEDESTLFPAMDRLDIHDDGTLNLLAISDNKVVDLVTLVIGPSCLVGPAVPQQESRLHLKRRRLEGWSTQRGLES